MSNLNTVSPRALCLLFISSQRKGDITFVPLYSWCCKVFQIVIN